MNYRHCKCNHKIRNLSPVENQEILNVLLENSDCNSSVSRSSDSCFEGKKDVCLVEKLYRRYLVNYYPPLFDIYYHEETEQQNDNDTHNDDSNVEIYIEDETSNDELAAHEILPILLERIYKSKIKLAFKYIYNYSKAVVQGEKALNLIESILTFKTEYLVTISQESSGRKQKLSPFGLSIMKRAFGKLQRQARENMRVIKGCQMLKRVMRYKNRQRLVRSWYKWKFFSSNYFTDNTNVFMDEDTVVMNNTKRRVASSIK